ncbi:putative glucosylceramidase 4 [Oppia nitens]|uniref:putative glucosylceramidase 4 n=1 Tax=Oppia nitens TaxID=1686743 RepID=UPI0023DA9607|nr:putative glucosylceramidase 4 [Oppia nitens]
MFQNILKYLLFLLLNSGLIVKASNPCSLRTITGADSVCVCNQTYCDDFPPIVSPKTGYALIYESGKTGKRFAETQIPFNHTMPFNANLIQTITIDRNQKYQSIIGFGGAFTDEFGMVLNGLPKELSQYLMDSYFSKNGIQYNMGRVPVASTDYSAHYYSYDDKLNDKQLNHFALTKEDLELKIPHIKTAQNLSTSPLRLFGSAWVAPDWMKTDPKSQFPNQLKGDTGGEYYDIFAKYLVKFLDIYKQHNITMWGLTTQNEPTWGRIFIPNDLYFDPNMQRVFVGKNLGPQLLKSGYTPDKLKLMIYDDNIYQTTDWHHTLQQFADQVFNDKIAEPFVSGMAYHWYESSRTDGYPDIVLDELNSKYPNKFMLMTEACHLDGLGNGRWDFGEHYAHDIIRDLNHWTIGWVEWNMALGLNGCPRCGPNQCGTAIVVDIEKGEAYKQPTFYIIGHFSKFIKPDSVRIAHQLSDNINNLFILSIIRPDNGVVVVVLNQNDLDIDLKINDKNNVLSYTIPARTIQTYIWW